MSLQYHEGDLENPNIKAMKRCNKKYIGLWLGWAFGDAMESNESLIKWVVFQSIHNGDNPALWPWSEQGLVWEKRPKRDPGYLGEVQFVESMVAGIGVSRLVAENAVASIVDIIVDELLDGGRITLEELGIFEVVDQSPRAINGVKEGAINVYPRGLKFRASKVFKGQIN